jgi:hypothetical protein
MFKNEVTVGQVFIGLLGSIRTIILFPLRLIAILLGVPNTKIIYKSGHVEYYYMLRLRYDRNKETGHITEIEWHTATQKEPFYIHMQEIESIVHIY